LTTASPVFDLRAPVAAALAENQPVVALESSILAQGLPWPHNLDAAREAAAAVAGAGAVPACIGVIGGCVRIGLDAGELETFARNAGGGIGKAATRDLPVLLARGADAATTVSATLYCARHAGIGVLATGGIGGVHRDAISTFDVSADLLELARTPAVVVCSGVKAILDLPRTLEALETLGVTVIGYGTGVLPAFWCRSSGLALETRADDPVAVVAIARARAALGAPGAVLVCVPAPVQVAVDPASMSGWIDAALTGAAQSGITGKAVTPFLLARVAQLSGGRTLAANLGLYRHNAAIAGAIAAATRA